MIKKNRGLTIIELLIYFSLVSIVLIMSIRGFKIFRLEAEITNGVRVVIASLNTARYSSISTYEKVKVLQDKNNICLQKKNKRFVGNVYQIFHQGENVLEI